MREKIFLGAMVLSLLFLASYGFADEIKLQTPEGEKVFPLERMEVKTKPIAEGSQIVVELNEDGTVVDLRKVP
jgi:hypothetical protein